MESRGTESVCNQLEEMRIICDREIPIQQQRMDSAHLSFQKSLHSATTKAQQILDLQVKLGKLKAELREAEDGLVKALAVKTKKEATRMATMDTLSATKARLEQLKCIVEDQRARKDEYAAIISQQSVAMAELEETHHQNIQRREDTEDAISWYNRVLGFRLECGHGVKFVFTNINIKNPNEQYTFTIRHENDVYTLLDCDPHLNDTKELMNELNKSNGLFKFVRTMREKFQEAATCGSFPQVSSHGQESAAISVSAPLSSVSTDSRSKSPPEENMSQPLVYDIYSRKVKNDRRGREAVLSSRSASSLRRSPRFKVPYLRSESPAEDQMSQSVVSDDRRGREAILSPQSASSLNHSPCLKVKK